MAISNVPLWQNAIDSLVKFIELVGQPMTLQDRDVVAPQMGGVDFDQSFTDLAAFIGAIDTESRGKTMFDGSNVETVLSFAIYMEFIEGVDITAEQFVLYNGRRVRIVSVEDIGELNGILKLNCTERGIETNESNKA